MKIPTDLMPMEYCAMWRELCTGYKLLEDGKDLRPGDAVILNAASGAVGAVVLQLCALLKLRAVAVVRERSGDEAHAKLEARLKALGAAEVLVDRGGSDFRRELEDRRFFAKPKLALDGVGGDAAARLADALQDGGRMTCFGCVSGKPVTLTWRQIIARGPPRQRLLLRRVGELEEEGRPEDARVGRQARQRGEDRARAHRVRARRRVRRGARRPRRAPRTSRSYSPSTDIGPPSRRAFTSIVCRSVAPSVKPERDRGVVRLDGEPHAKARARRPLERQQDARTRRGERRAERRRRRRPASRARMRRLARSRPAPAAFVRRRSSGGLVTRRLSDSTRSSIELRANARCVLANAEGSPPPSEYARRRGRALLRQFSSHVRRASRATQKAREPTPRGATVELLLLLSREVRSGDCEVVRGRGCAADGR